MTPGEEGSDVAGKPITDVVLGGQHYSLKLLGKKTVVKGSFSNMIQHFIDYDHVIYLDARRQGSTLHFSEFDITLEKFLDVFFRPWAKIKQSTKKYSTLQSLTKALGSYGKKAWKVGFATMPLTRRGLAQQIGISSTKRGFDIVDGVPSEELKALLAVDPKLLKPFGPFTVHYSEERFGGTKLKKLFGSARQFNEIQEALAAFNAGQIDRKEMIARLLTLPGAGGGGKSVEQFVFTAEQVKDISSYREVGVLELGEPAMKKIWLQHGELLNATMAPVYETLNRFTDNVNEYFLASDKTRGNQAVKDAEDLETATSTAVKGLGADPGQMTKQQIAQMNRRTKAHMAKYGENRDRGLLITDEAFGINTEKE